MNGTICTLQSRFGFIRGDDGVQRFFLPSALHPSGPQFAQLRVGQAVTFTHTNHARGPRATEIRVWATDRTSVAPAIALADEEE